MASEIQSPAHRFAERPSVVRKIEVLDGEPAPVVPRIESSEDPGEVDDPGRVVDVQLGLALTSLSELDVAGKFDHFAWISSPVGDMARIHKEPQTWDFIPNRHHGV